MQTCSHHLNDCSIKYTECPGCLDVLGDPVTDLHYLTCQAFKAIPDCDPTDAIEKEMFGLIIVGTMKRKITLQCADVSRTVILLSNVYKR